MIRPLTLLSIVAAAGAGLHVYNTKHAVSLLDRELRTIAQGIVEAEARTQALKADWSLASEQEGLRVLAQRHLALEPMQPAQFVRFAEAERRLPPPAAPDGPAAPFAPRDTAAEKAATRIALLLPEETPASRAASLTAASAPAPATPPLSVPALAAVAQAALAAATAPLPLPAPAAPEMRPVGRVGTAALAAPPSPPVARAPEPRPAAIEVVRASPPPRPLAVPPRPVAPVRLVPEIPPALAVAAAAPSTRQPVVARVAIAAATPSRAPDAAATSLGSFGSALGGGDGGSVLGSARAALPPPVAFGSAGTALR
jgi:hypothetical protein